jgi:hypothetical protein
MDIRFFNFFPSEAKFIVDDQSSDIPKGIDAIIGLDMLAKTSESSGVTQNRPYRVG